MWMATLQGILILFLVVTSPVAAQNATTTAPVAQVNATTVAVAQVNTTTAPVSINATTAPVSINATTSAVAQVNATTAPMLMNETNATVPTNATQTPSTPMTPSTENISETSPPTSFMSTTEMTTTPTPTPTPDPSRFTSIDTEIQIVGLSEKEIEDILNKNSAARKDFEKQFEKTMRKLLKDIADFIIRNIRRGSIIVQYTIVLNGSSPEQVQQAIKTINDQIKTGKVGDFQVNKKHSTVTKVTVTADKFKACEQPKDKSESDKTTLLILLSVAVGVLGLLVIVFMIMICVLCKKKNMVHDVAGA